MKIKNIKISFETIEIFEKWWKQTKILNANTTPILKAAFKDLCFKAWINGYKTAKSNN